MVERASAYRASTYQEARYVSPVEKRMDAYLKALEELERKGLGDPLRDSRIYAKRDLALILATIISRVLGLDSKAETDLYKNLLEDNAVLKKKSYKNIGGLVLNISAAVVQFGAAGLSMLPVVHAVGGPVAALATKINLTQGVAQALGNSGQPLSTAGQSVGQFSSNLDKDAEAKRTMLDLEKTLLETSKQQHQERKRQEEEALKQAEQQSQRIEEDRNRAVTAMVSTQG